MPAVAIPTSVPPPAEVAGARRPGGRQIRPLYAGECHTLAGAVAIPVPPSAPAPPAETGRISARPADGPTSSAEAELRALMAMAAHDLKSPLATATANLEMLREDHTGQIDDDGQRCLRAAERALRRLNALAEDLLAYATADQRAVDLRPMSLAGEIAEQITDVEAEVSVPGSLPAVLADPSMLRHLLDNLIGNAVKYSPPDTVARIEISARPAPDGLLRVEIADRGIGIPEADRPRVFDAFHRCANSGAYQGTGLGLAICRRIVERHGGRIGVDENPGGGSRFWFTLPAARS
jgi:signal transduction histidine kinase